MAESVASWWGIGQGSWPRDSPQTSRDPGGETWLGTSRPAMACPGQNRCPRSQTQACDEARRLESDRRIEERGRCGERKEEEGRSAIACIEMRMARFAMVPTYSILFEYQYCRVLSPPSPLVSCSPPQKLTFFFSSKLRVFLPATADNAVPAGPAAEGVGGDTGLTHVASLVSSFQ